MESELPRRSEPRIVWLIEVPKHGFRWYTEDHERVLFWERREDTIVTTFKEQCDALPDEPT